MRTEPLIILAVLLSGCTVLQEAREVASPRVEGELSFRAPRGETVAWRPDLCLSGEHEQFFGFILGSNEGEVVLRAVLDPLDGPGLRLSTPEGTGIFRPDLCERLELDVAPTGWRVNEIQDLSGRLDVSCSTPDGASIEGSVEVRHCH